MLISCPNCQTTFAIPAKAIGATGRKVKCSKCENTWVQAPLQMDSLNLLQPDFNNSRNLPVRFKTHKFKPLYAVTLVVLLIIAGAMEVGKSPIKYPIIAQKIKLPDYNGIRFHDFHVDSEIVENKRDFHLKGSILNMTDKRIRIPVVDIKIYSQGGRIMQKTVLAVPKEFLDPYEQVEVSPEITRVSGNADRIELSFENWIESTLR